MNKILFCVIFLVITACSSSREVTSNGARSPASRAKWVEAEFETGWCLQVEQARITSLLAEIYVIEEYDREYYYLSRYVPVEREQDFFESLTYEPVPSEWQLYSSQKRTLQSAHAKYVRVKCPRLGK